MDKPLWQATLVAAATLLLAQPATAQITFYENDGFGGRSFTTQSEVENFNTLGFNDRASSVVVQRDTWQACDNAGFGGRCVTLRPGRYTSFSAMGLNDRISSVRRVDDRGYQVAAPDYRRRDSERLFQANVTQVHAVMSTPQQHCWVERGAVQERGDARVPGALVGALIGGVLGHQIGGGSGRDLATVGGVLAGGAVGARVGRNQEGPVSQDVQRCAESPGSSRQPEYWDVSYNFRGQEHHVQMTQPPGATISVNEQGEPRL
jgi:uncharacterized protein YcfJ